MDNINMNTNINKKIQNKIILQIIGKENIINGINFSFSLLNKTENLFVLHIFNPNTEYIKFNKSNRPFFEKIVNLLFTKDNNTGCFNHQNDNNSELYNKTQEEIINNYLNIQYTFVLVKIDGINLLPTPLFCFDTNYIYNVCTGYYYRKKGYMTILLTHFLKLVKQNKLKIDSPESIKLDVVKINPKYDSVVNYYKNLKFKEVKFQFNLDRTVLERNMN
jgi:hypothetical protein